MQKNSQKPTKAVSANKEIKKNSFYEIPYIASNPELMIANFSKTPDVVLDAKKQFFMAQTPLFDVKTNYKNCGSLYVVSTEIEYKTNLCFKTIDTLPFPSNYYCLTLRINHPNKKNKSLVNDFAYSDNAWLFFKPNAMFDHYHFNGTKGNDFCIYVTIDWLKNYIKQSPLKNRKTIKLFLDSAADFLISLNLSEIFNIEDSKLKNILDISKDHDLDLTKKVDFMFSSFILALQQENITASHFEVSNFHRLKILEAEKIIQSYKYKKFPSIRYIANKVSISETQLKQHFKTVYGCTLLKYFQTLQMGEAKSLLVSKKYKVPEVAQKMGYQNASKFSARFKKEFGITPSSLYE